MGRKYKMVPARTDTGLRKSHGPGMLAAPAPSKATLEEFALSLPEGEEGKENSRKRGNGKRGTRPGPRGKMGAKGGRRGGRGGRAQLTSKVADMEELVNSLRNQIETSAGEMEGIDRKLGSIKKIKADLQRSLASAASPHRSPFAVRKANVPVEDVEDRVEKVDVPLELAALSRPVVETSSTGIQTEVWEPEPAPAPVVETAEAGTQADAVCQACVEANEAVETANASIESLTQRIQELKDCKACAQAELAHQNLMEELAEAKAAAEAECPECPRLGETVAALQAEVADAQAAAQAPCQECVELKAQVETAVVQATEAAANAVALQVKVDELTHELETKGGEISVLKTELEEAKAAGAEAKQAHMEETTRVAELEGMVAVEKARGDAAEAEVDEANAQIEVLVSEAEAQLAEAEKAEAAAAETLEKVKSALETAVADAEARVEEEKAKAERSLNEAGLASQETIAQMQAMFNELEGNCSELAGTCETLSAQLDEAEKTNARLENEAMDAQETIKTQEETRAELDAQVSDLSGQVSSLTTSLAAETEAHQTLEASYAALQAELDAVKAKRHTDELHRRQLHEMVQRLRGNIRVFCRVRPLVSGESGDLGAYEFPPENGDFTHSVVVHAPGKGAGARERDYDFPFDAVFGPGASQEEVYAELDPFVQSALDGFNVCIFAYGQTGSGKTYTMEGYPDAGEEAAGMIPRAVSHVFGRAEALKELGWEFSFQASYLEIYNETVRDLQAPGEEGCGAVLDLRMDRETGETYAEGLTWRDVATAGDISDVLESAREVRAVGSTNMNERSSRSHSVFTLGIKGRNAGQEIEWSGRLNLIDLAGSERLARSQATGDRLKETQNINKSLSALSACIAAIGKKQSHIPYRNSKLTYLLKTSLGGNAKVLMFSNVSPAGSNIQESLCTLRFAVNVNNTAVGIAHKQSQSQKK